MRLVLQLPQALLPCRAFMLCRLRRQQRACLMRIPAKGQYPEGR